MVEPSMIKIYLWKLEKTKRETTKDKIVVFFIPFGVGAVKFVLNSINFHRNIVYCPIHRDES